MLLYCIYDFRLTHLQVERALKAWSNGFIDDDNIENFSQKLYGPQTEAYLSCSTGLQDSTWVNILDATLEWVEQHGDSILPGDYQALVECGDAERLEIVE